jgi:multidrug efflux system outer membrane protein
MKRAGALVASLWMLAGCVAVPPRAAPPPLRTQAPLSSLPGTETAGGGAWPGRAWWRGYGDPTLDELIERALADSPTLAAAQARLQAATASVRSAAAVAGARIDSSADAGRQRLSDNGLFPPRILGFSWYSQADLGLQFSYTFDWWGKERAHITAALDQVRAAQADHDAATLALAGSIAQSYFGWQADQGRLQLAQEAVATIEARRAIADARVRAELARAEELEQVDVDLAAAREQALGLETSARMRIIVLAALLAIRPEELPALTPRPLPALQAQLPPHVSLDLIARRADIEASRWRVEAAARGADAARAGFMPDISVQALLGLSSIDYARLLEAGSAVPQATAAVHLPIFDAGQLRAAYQGSQAQLQVAIATYDATVVTAAQEVGAQALTRTSYAGRRPLRLEQVRLTAQQQEQAAARVRQGLTDPRPQLLARAQWLQARDVLLQLDAAALDADLGLIRALGGGYVRAEGN